MPQPLLSVTLQSERVRLEPLSLDHVEALMKAASGPRESFRYSWVPEPTLKAVTFYITSALAARDAETSLPFATVRLDNNEVVGTTRFMSAEYWTSSRAEPSTSATPNAIEIGSTWLHSDSQRTFVNTEAKFLMLTYAFETLKIERLFLKTDSRNQTSRKNIERIGARFEGILRHHMFATDAENSEFRDTAMYSIIRAEWPSVQSLLHSLLERP